jgi:methionine synthase reductase
MSPSTPPNAYDHHEEPEKRSISNSESCQSQEPFKLMFHITPIRSEELIGLPRLPQPSLSIEYHEDLTTEEPIGENGRSMYSPFWARLNSVTCLTAADAVKRTLEMELDIEGSHMTFLPGDAFGILPLNPKPLVDALLKRLHADPAQRVRLIPKLGGSMKESHLRPRRLLSLFDLFQREIDLMGIPKKALFRIMAEYMSSEEERQIALYLCSIQGKCSVYNIYHR